MGLTYTDSRGNVWRVRAAQLAGLRPCRIALEKAIERGADENTLERMREAIRRIVRERNEC